MSGEISVISTIDTAHEDMIVSYCYSVVFVKREMSYANVLFIWSIVSLYSYSTCGLNA